MREELNTERGGWGLWKPRKSFPCQEKEVRVRTVGGNEEHNGINIIMGSLIECASAPSPVSVAERPMVTQSTRGSFWHRDQRESFLSLSATLSLEKTAQIWLHFLIWPADSQQSETWKWIAMFWLPAAANKRNIIFTQFNLIEITLSTVQWKMLCFSWKKEIVTSVVLFVSAFMDFVFHFGWVMTVENNSPIAWKAKNTKEFHVVSCTLKSSLI